MALERRATRLTLRAPVAGVVADLRPEDLVGRQVHAGDSLLTVVALDSVEARIALGGAGATQVHPGQVVHLVSYADPGVPRTGRVTDVSAAGVRSSNGIGAVEARVRLAPGDAWRPGIRGEASVDLEGSTLFGVLWWKLKQSVRTDLWL